MSFQIEDIIINPDLPDSLFTLSTLPEGYETLREGDQGKLDRPELLKAGIKAPSWTLKNGENKSVSLNDYRGRIVILDFWGTWCLPCLEAMPELQKIHDKYEGVTVIGASSKEPSNADPVGFARNRDITYPILLNGEKIAEKYNVTAYPTFYIIGKEGSILYRASGFGDGVGKNIEKQLDDHLQR